ncbi:Putative redox-active protein (C_GCAxxG_C_C) [Alkaliphilus peptidifermentans DSM 18978]|uniref:Putative redox-active protein (C_GCAxxG_C_C) n=1 Tax=Alkaliphilus peptidifermentans DSM 18978 TaxID=1120976 RepID=A0A1G5EXP2_9FIRM|nr:Putative redox-active protein (C_GCAxxG_C_C) [Alkaliphilus peptidifermentans DSM 18978]
MADEVGYPFNQIPAEAFTNAAAGYAGQASLCGSLGVAAACIGTVCDVETAKKLVGDLWDWYKEHPFPQYQPAELDLAMTVADSVLCIDSVGKYMEAQGCGFGDDERKERCAGVAAEILKKTVEMLNETL